MRRVIAVVAGLVLLALADIASAQTPPTRPAAADGPVAEVQEWLILVTDPNSSQASAANMYGSSLPDFASPRRPSATGEKLLEPSPMGLLRFVAAKDAGDARFDVLLNIKGGRFMGNWPKATNRTTGLLWQDWQLKAAPVSPESLNPRHWFNRLRSGESAWLVKNNMSERFIAYDTELSYTNPIQIRANGKLKYLAWNTGTAPLHDVSIYKKSNDGWHITELALLEPSAAPATQPSTKPGTAAAATQSVASRPGPTTRNVAEPLLGGGAVKDAAAALAPWKARLTAAGLSPIDFDVILSILEKYGLDENRMTIIYRLDPSEMERMLPIEIVPQPRKVTRVGLVILKNIDPAITQEIDDLIAQLGDPDWSRREAAQKQLSELGLPTKTKLEEAAKNSKDMEIVWRAERLLSRINREASK